MRLISLLFIFTFYSTFSQEVINIDSSFTSVEYPLSKLTYYHDIDNKEDIETITTKKFEAFNKKPSGLKFEKLWLKVDLNNQTTNSKKLIFKIKATAIKTLKLYEKKGGVLKEIHPLNNQFKRKIDIPIILSNEKITTYYFEILFSRSVFFPIKIVSLKKNKSLEIKNLIELSMFYSFSLMVFLINLFFFISTKNRFFLYYNFLLLSIVFSIAHLDGLLYVLHDKIYSTNYILILLNFLVISSYILFTTNALQLNKNLPKINKIGAVIVLIYIILTITYLITGNIYWFSLGKICYFGIILLYWFSGVLLFKKQIYARFLVLGYSLLIICNILFMLPLIFGTTSLGFTETHYKIGSVIEMLIFLYAISYRHKDVEKKREVFEASYEESIENIKELEEKIRLQKNKAEIECQQQVQLFQEKYDLNDREIEVLKGSLKGLKNKEIATKICLSEASIKHYNGRLFEKTNTKNKIQLINLFNTYTSK